MSRYSASIAKAAPTTGTCVMMIRPAAGRTISVVEVGFFMTTSVAAAPSIGLYRNATTGTPSTSTLVQSEEMNGVAGTTNLDTAWSAAPTVNAIRNRGIILPVSTIGAGWVWTFPEGKLKCSPGGTTQLCLWHFGAATIGAMEVYAVVEE